MPCTDQEGRRGGVGFEVVEGGAMAGLNGAAQSGLLGEASCGKLGKLQRRRGASGAQGNHECRGARKILRSSEEIRPGAFVPFYSINLEFLS